MNCQFCNVETVFFETIWAERNPDAKSEKVGEIMECPKCNSLYILDGKGFRLQEDGRKLWICPKAGECVVDRAFTSKCPHRVAHKEIVGPVTKNSKCKTSSPRCPMCSPLPSVEQEVKPSLRDLYPNDECYRERLNELESITRSINDMAHKDKDCHKCYPKEVKPLSTKDAIKKVFDELMALSPEEFQAEVEKHKDGDIAKMLIHSGYFEKGGEGYMEKEVKPKEVAGVIEANIISYRDLNDAYEWGLIEGNGGGFNSGKEYAEEQAEKEIASAEAKGREDERERVCDKAMGLMAFETITEVDNPGDEGYNNGINDCIRIIETLRKI